LERPSFFCLFSSPSSKTSDILLDLNGKPRYVEILAGDGREKKETVISQVALRNNSHFVETIFLCITALVVFFDAHKELKQSIP